MGMPRKAPQLTSRPLLAQYLPAMWNGKKVSIIFPTYNEKDSIRAAIEDFFASGYVDEIVVVNNNAAAGTDDEVRPTRARLVYETQQGYGYAIWKGLDEATGDILIISEPDGTFLGADVVKLLAFSDDVPVVFGTRTAREFVWDGANMGIFLKWGNYAVGKLVEFLFNTTFLSDVGCSMRLLHREVYEVVRPQFRIGGSAFGPHLMLLVILNGFPFVEIPVNYRKRVGISSVTGSKMKAWFLGWEMIWMILRTRIGTWLGYIPQRKQSRQPRA
jgi:glycosyltransferase involved in cell wall biosynthesis